MAVNQPDTAKALGDAYGNVASAIAAGGIRSLTDANSAINRELQIVGPHDRAWKPLGDAIAKYIQENAQTIQKAERIFRETSEGYLAAAEAGR